MKELSYLARFGFLAIWLMACHDGPSRVPGSFGDDVAFLGKHTEVVLLSDPAGQALVAVVPEYQGRVMTSTSGGLQGPSFGWIHRNAVASGERKPHINVFGGEDRFWLGPEGGQYSIFFSRNAPFNLEHWQTPEPLDWGPWDIVSESKTEIQFRREMQLTNYSGSKFQLRADRIVRLLSRDQVSRQFDVAISRELEWVAYESENRITNTGGDPWSKETGLLSIWILGMFKPSDDTTIVIPFRSGHDSELGPVVNDAYFGKVPADRLKVGDGILFFKGDGKWRSKIGIGPNRATPILGSYAENEATLTLVRFSLPGGASDYVNSMWEIQEHPYKGDVVNSYNDGPPEPGAAPLGPFYELETSSAAAGLSPGETLTHIHRTVHVRGSREELHRLSEATLGVGLAEIASAF